MKWFSIGLAISTGWYLGNFLIDFLFHVFIQAVKKTGWYQTIMGSQGTIGEHKYTNTVKNKIGFDIN